MSEMDWLDFVGVVSGAIGTITGIIGAIMGYISYRKANSLKALDLRLELTRAATQLRADLSQLGNLIEHANNSRKDVAAATGTLHSGYMVTWNKEIKKDHPAVIKIKSWVDEQYAKGRVTAISDEEMLQMSKKYLPEYFKKLSKKELQQ